MYKAIALDAFGTVGDITDRRNPYHQMFKLLPIDHVTASRLALTSPMTPRELAVMLSQGRADVLQLLPKLEQDVSIEQHSIRLFPETITVLEKLRQLRLPVAIISNLAQPYGEPLERLLRGLVDHFIFSYKVGAIKPEPKIFEALCDSLQLLPKDILVVGNSRKNDFEGARAFGMPALFLDRSGTTQEERAIADLIGILSHLTRQY